MSRRSFSETICRFGEQRPPTVLSVVMKTLEKTASVHCRTLLHVIIIVSGINTALLLRQLTSYVFVYVSNLRGNGQNQHYSYH